MVPAWAVVWSTTTASATARTLTTPRLEMAALRLALQARKQAGAAHGSRGPQERKLLRCQSPFHLWGGRLSKAVSRKGPLFACSFRADAAPVLASLLLLPRLCRAGGDARAGAAPVGAQERGKGRCTPAPHCHLRPALHHRSAGHGWQHCRPRLPIWNAGHCAFAPFLPGSTPHLGR